jgi:hypothetical protein
MNSTAQISRPSFGEALAEIVPLVGFVPAYGPPVIAVLGPWLLLGLILSGPLAWFFALVVVLIVAATVVTAITASIVVAPVLLVRHVRRHRARHASISARTAQVVTIESPRVAT